MEKKWYIIYTSGGKGNYWIVELTFTQANNLQDILINMELVCGDLLMGDIRIYKEGFNDINQAKLFALKNYINW